MLPRPPFLLSAELNRASVESFKTYPFHLPAVKGLERIEFTQPVTFFVGENGSGKSTLLEAIAIKWGMNAEGGGRNYRFSTRETHSPLHQHLTLARSYRRASDDFFLRAESFYNLATAAEELGSFPGLHDQSHGESFMTILLERFLGDGLYLLDEPEAGLSPVRQMAMLVRMHDLVRGGSQFIIASHSPILLAFPGATIFQFDADGIRETEHYLVSRRFLEDPVRMLDELLKDPEED